MSNKVPENIKDENSEEIDLSFLPENEKILWKSTGWVNYSEIYKSSLRTFLVTNIIAISICAIIGVLVILYAKKDSWHLTWLLPLIYLVILFLAWAGQGLFIAIGPFAFISILKYKKTYPSNELNPYRWFKLLSAENIVFKEVENPIKKWSEYQKKCFKFENDRIICPIEHIKRIVIQPGLLGYYHFLVYGKTDEINENTQSRQHRLLKWELSGKEIQNMLYHLYTLQKDEKLSLEIEGTDVRIVFGILLLALIICTILGVF